MNVGWLVVAVVGAATVSIKAAGPLLLGGRALAPRLVGVIGLLAPALLAALIATLTFGGEGRLMLDARVAGVATAGVALLLRIPVLGAVVLAAVVTALLRASGWG